MDDELIGGHEEFMKWAMENHGYKDKRYKSTNYMLGSSSIFCLRATHELVFLHVVWCLYQVDVKQKKNKESKTIKRRTTINAQ